MPRSRSSASPSIGGRTLAISTALLVLGACGGDDPTRVPVPADPVQPDTVTLAWRPVGQLPEGGLDGLASDVGLAGVYVAGGERADGVLSDGFHLFDSDDGWTELASLPYPVRDAHLVNYTEAIFLAGGLREEDGRRVVSDDLYRYDVEGDRWTLVGRTPVPVFGGAAGLMDGWVSIVGAFHDVEGEGSPEVFGYYPETGEWRTLDPPEVPRIGPSGTARQGDLLVAGGRDAVSGEPVQTVEVHHNRVWNSDRRMPEPRIGVAGGRLRSRTYLFGGLDPAGVPVKPYALRFEPELQRWATVRTPPMELPVQGHQVESRGEQTFLILGGRRADGSMDPTVVQVTIPTDPDPTG